MKDPPSDYTQYELRNPVGSYRRTFELPAGWNGQRVFLEFAGVKSAFYVWVNGRRVRPGQHDARRIRHNPLSDGR